jgi:cell division initiation protein
MALSPLDVSQQKFKGRFGGGVDRTEVEAFMRVVATELERLIKDNEQLREENKGLARSLDEHQRREDTVRETLLTATRVTDDLKKQAEKEADIIMGKAELDAERLLEAAQARRGELLKDIGELRRQRVQFLQQVKSQIDAHQALLDVAAADDGEKKLEETLAVLRKRSG